MDRKPHFLDEHVEKLRDAGNLSSEHKLGSVWYNRHGDCVMFLSINEGVVADHIDERLTLYRAAIDEERVIGFQLKGIKALMSEFDYDFAQVQAQIENDEVQAVTLSLMFLKSFQKAVPTRKSLMGYAEAMTNFPQLSDCTEEKCH